MRLMAVMVSSVSIAGSGLLRVLRKAALVAERRSCGERLYQLEPQRLQSVASWIEGCRGF